MAQFEDNNPFAGTGRRLSSSSGVTSDFAPLSITPVTGPDDSKSAIENTWSDVPSKSDNAESSSVAESADKTSGQEPKVYSSRIEQILCTDPNTNITIVEAGKSREGSSRGYIAYTIKIKDITVRRRYSEFESLRNTLVKLFPTLIIPPIPEKHSMSSYASAPTKAKEDATIIEHRRRMLGVFLNRCKSMPQVKSNSVFQRFLDPNSSWSEILNSPPVSDLPKNILKAPPLNPAAHSIPHSYLPVPPSSAKLKSQEDPKFKEAEVHAKEYENVIVNGLEKVNRRIIKRYTDEAADLSELGARFNAFSLEENGAVATSIERVGQAIDNSYLATQTLVSSLSNSFSEPLGESAQFAAVVRAVLKYRRQKALQLEMTQDSLAAKKATLESLEKVEQEAQRLNAYLHGESLNTSFHSPSSSIGSSSGEPVLNDSAVTQSPKSPKSDTDQTTSTSQAPDESFPPTHAEAPTTIPGIHKKKSGFKFPGIGKLNNAISGIIDNDPETTRRNNIGKTREQIAELESALKVAQTDVEEASESVKKDMERFQKTKEDDLRQMMRAYIQCHLEWAQNNLESWQRAKAEIEKI